MATEIIYKDRDNHVDLQLTLDGVALTSEQMSAITKVEILFMGYYYDSENFPDAFDWDTRASEGTVGLHLSEIPTITTGRDENTELIVYDSVNTDGIIWSTFDLQVKELFGAVAATA